MYSRFFSRVAAGVAECDKRWPGWYENIDCDKLNLEHVCDCVLGQLHRYNRDEYLEGQCLTKNIISCMDSELGFYLTREEQVSDDKDDYWRALRAEWIRQINLKRTEVS